MQNGRAWAIAGSILNISVASFRFGSVPSDGDERRLGAEVNAGKKKDEDGIMLLRRSSIFLLEAVMAMADEQGCCRRRD